MRKRRYRSLLLLVLVAAFATPACWLVRFFFESETVTPANHALIEQRCHGAPMSEDEVVALLGAPWPPNTPPGYQESYIKYTAKRVAVEMQTIKAWRGREGRERGGLSIGRPWIEVGFDKGGRVVWTWYYTSSERTASAWMDRAMASFGL